ncbi:MAG: DUF4091 domain-containing protein [Kiritimatiellae bacterium]|nr:DUF4091 domain-containing protein [Kiritimatiellia bacterium]
MLRCLLAACGAICIGALHGDDGGWQPFGDGFATEAGGGDGAHTIWRCEAKMPRMCSGVCRSFRYPKPSLEPLIYGGWSRSEGVSGGECCLFLDVYHDDGTATYGLKVAWPCDTPDWTSRAGFHIPKKPVSEIKMYAFLRRGTGTAWFRDVYLERREGRGDALYSYHRTRQPYAPIDTVVVSTLVGREQVDRTFSIPSIGRVPCPLATNAVVVWTADSMRRVTPLSFPTADDIPAKPIRLDVAQGERESAQICISAGEAAGLDSATLQIVQPRNEEGRAWGGSVSWQRIGYVPRMPGKGLSHPESPPLHETWLPDPLLPPAPFRVRGGSTQGAWLTVHANVGADEPGVYRGAVRVRTESGEVAHIPLEVRVRRFALPETFGLATAFSVMDGFTRAQYSGGDVEARIRESHDIMLDHRLNPDDISRTAPPRIEDLVHARSRGMNRFNVVNLVPPPKDANAKWRCFASPKEVFSDEFYASLKAMLEPYVERLRAAGLMQYAYIYGFDERGEAFYDGMAKLHKRLSRDFPDLPLLTTAYSYRSMKGRERSDIPDSWFAPDWFCPLTKDYDLDMTSMLKGRGKQVWWYTSCSPGYPYANMAPLENSWCEGRILLGWQTYLYRADGFLFWHVNWWEDQALMDESDTYFPAWRTYGCMDAHGDGVFLYPGRDHVLPSIRLAQVRDGVEDYEWLKCYAEPLCGADAVEKYARMLVKDLKDFVRIPERIRAVRSQLADFVERKAESPEAIQGVASPR